MCDINDKIIEDAKLVNADDDITVAFNYQRDPTDNDMCIVNITIDGERWKKRPKYDVRLYIGDPLYSVELDKLIHPGYVENIDGNDASDSALKVLEHTLDTIIPQILEMTEKGKI